LLRALLLQMLYSSRSERLLMEQLHFNLLFGAPRHLRGRIVHSDSRFNDVIRIGHVARATNSTPI
jgi:hypothetical protein